MIDLGLTDAQERLFEEALFASHEIRTKLRIYDADEKPLNLLQPRMLTGAVQVDANAAVRRSLNVQLLDPERKLHFEHANPAAGAFYADNFVKATYGVYVEALSDWVDVPVFFGPVTGFQRDGDVVTLEAQGKEALGLSPIMETRGYTIRKGTTVARAIKKVMGRAGETKFALGMLDNKLHKRRAVIPGEEPWQVCAGGETDSQGKPMPPLISKATGSHWYLFYDGRGVLTAHRLNTRSVFHFRHDQHVLSDPGYTYDALAFRNYARVVGGVPKGAKRRVWGKYALPAAHPMSPAALSRNGQARYLPIFHESDGLKKKSDCRAKAKQLVKAAAFEGVSAQFDSLPVPHLEENDLVTLRMKEYTLTFRLSTFTIPLTTGDPMAVGFTRRALMPHHRRHR